MAKVSHARTVGVHLKNEIADLINERATRLGWSESKYLRGIIERWIEEGAPYLSALDKMASEVAGNRAQQEKESITKSETAFESFAKEPTKNKKK